MESNCACNIPRFPSFLTIVPTNVRLKSLVLDTLDWTSKF